MADNDLGDGPSLELPKLFGRKDKKRRGDDLAPTDEPSAATEPSTASGPEAPAPEGADRPAVDPAEVTMPLPVPAPAAPEPTPEPVAPTPPTERAPAPFPVTAATRVDPRPEPGPAAAATGRRRLPTAPAMPTAVAAVLVGALVAVLGIGLTWLGLLGCDAIRGTQSCGGPGLLVMLAIMAAMVVSGAALLKALGVPQGGSLSFLGFGILAVVVLMFLIEHLYEPWALVAIPVISAVGYGIAHWVTTRFTEPDPDLRR